MTNPVQLRLAASLIRKGAVIAYPTEAVWGLGCDPFNPDAVSRLLAMKGRGKDKGLIIVAASLEQIAPALTALTSTQRRWLVEKREHPTTWLVPDNGYFPAWISGHFDTVAIRISKFKTLQRLCQYCGPMV